MSKSRKTDDFDYIQEMPDVEIILSEMRSAFSRAEYKISRTHTEFRNKMIEALFETMLETDRAKKELTDTVQKLKEHIDVPITEEDLPF